MAEAIRVESNRAVGGRGVWLRFFLLIPLIVALAVACHLHIKVKGSTFEALSWNPVESTARVSPSDVHTDKEGVIEVVAAEITGLSYLHVTLRALGDGETRVSAEVGADSVTWDIKVHRGLIIEDGVNFSGWESLHLSLIVLLGVTSLMFASVFVTLYRQSWYGYKMVASGAGALFTFFHFLLFSLFLIRGSLRDFRSLLMEATWASNYFALAMLVPLGVMAVLLALSNIILIRREGFRPKNLLGICCGLLLVGIYGLWRGVTDWLVVRWHLPASATYFNTIMAMGITYGECLLASIIVSALLAAKHEPRSSADYTIILGCGLRPDGTPSPLLAGRIERALAFDKAHVAQGERPTTFVPSGGQGPDEVISEGESMRNYLIDKGVADTRTIAETASATTRENMEFSRELIESTSNEPVSAFRILFSTTNYHVFRGYVCAHQAGMTVEGLGAKTRLYFWPNAFLREMAGVVAAKWQAILLTYLAITCLYLLADFVLLHI